jgi:hypothetical protein
MHLCGNAIWGECWHNYCSLLWQLTRLASRGGRIRTSTRFRFFGGSVQKRGLAPAPFFIRPSSFVVAGRCGSFASRECVIEVVQFGGPDPLGPSFYFLVFPSTYFTRFVSTGERQSVPATAYGGLTKAPARNDAKKMSGRWGDRPLGRGGWRVLQPEAGPNLPHVLLRSRAAERDTGANRPKPFYSGSRNQLPITVTILRSRLLRVDSPTGSFCSVLLADSAYLVLVPPYFKNFTFFVGVP